MIKVNNRNKTHKILRLFKTSTQFAIFTSSIIRIIWIHKIKMKERKILIWGKNLQAGGTHNGCKTGNLAETLQIAKYLVHWWTRQVQRVAHVVRLARVLSQTLLSIILEQRAHSRVPWLTTQPNPLMQQDLTSLTEKRATFLALQAWNIIMTSHPR